MNRIATTCFLLALTSTVYSRVILLRHVEPSHYPRYAYKYSVHDPKTKDHKEHWETRNGDLVKGAYSLVEPDGKLRVVDYWADDANGFNADVQRLGPGEHPPAIQQVAVLEQPDKAKQEPPQDKPVEESPQNSPPQQESVAEPPVTNDVSDEAVKPLVLPVNYGFGSDGVGAPLGQEYANVYSTGSLRWDTNTNSYGGWVPLKPKEVKYASIFTKKYVDGKLHEWAIGPISLVGRTLVFKVKHR